MSLKIKTKPEHFEEMAAAGFAFHELFEWLAGDDLQIVRDLGRYREILEIEATGRELQLIRDRFENLPVPKGDRAVWFNETARFILANL